MIKTGIVQIFDGTPGRGVDHVVEFAKHVELCQFDSLWVPDHVVFFDKYDSKYPHTDTGEIDFKVDQGIYEPSMTLLAAGLNTSRIRLGTSVEIITERNPIVRARELATLDVATLGRVEYGIGVGWSAEEYAALGIPFEKRGQRADEYIEAMRILWSETRPSYKGDFVEFEPLIFEPKPMNRRIPIMVGGNSIAALSRVARLGDGWHGWNLSLSELAEKISELKLQLQKNSRSIIDVKLNIGIPFRGDLSELVAYRDGCVKLGINEIVIAMGFSRSRYKEQLSELAGRLEII
ncbi:MAG: LLM class F420-dependent oxidoreductase [Gammaproteobacteria bacterium]